ncbi:hypothetical protein HKX48_004711 [Thoreauomyces humboldtii]|nr:hypothetical protein HKX48_004711 [Thoreauomyces humboldtii]
MASEGYEAPTWHKFVGLGLAVLSSSFIGVSFVIKKRALLNTELKAGRLGQTPDETNLGHAYLKNPLWWVGIVMMLTGEVCNLGAYAFAPAVLVTPLGALSVVISAGLSAAILGEHLSFSAKIGMAQCVLGATILVLHAPATSATTTIASFFDRVITAGFLVWFCLNVLAVLILIFYVSPRWGHKNVIVPILICSLTGGTVVIATQGLGAAIVYSFSVADASEASQFTDWRLYFLLVYVLGSGVLQINFLNKALELFSTAVVTPIYYVCFSAATLIGSAILFKTFATVSAAAGASVIIGFFVIIGGKKNCSNCKPKLWVLMRQQSLSHICRNLFHCHDIDLPPPQHHRLPFRPGPLTNHTTEYPESAPSRSLDHSDVIRSA